MTEAEQKARAVVEDIARQVEIDHGTAGNWCPEYTYAAVADALEAHGRAEREAGRLEGIELAQQEIEGHLDSLHYAQERQGLKGSEANAYESALEQALRSVRALLQPKEQSEVE